MRLGRSCIGRWGIPFIGEFILSCKRMVGSAADCHLSRITNYYNDGEDAFDMRKPMSRDKNRECVREDGENVKVSPEDVW